MEPTSPASPMSTSAALSTEEETIVAAFDTVLEAEMARGRLEVEGIDARIVDGNTVGIAAHLSMALGGVKVVVDLRDLEAARSILFSPSAFAEDEMPADSEPAPVVTLTADDLASRALTASVLGCLIAPPLGHLWSLVLLASVWRRRHELGTAGLRKARIALVVDGIVCAAVAVAVAALL